MQESLHQGKKMHLFHWHTAALAQQLRVGKNQRFVVTKPLWFCYSNAQKYQEGSRPLLGRVK